MLDLCAAGFFYETCHAHFRPDQEVCISWLFPSKI